MFTDKRLAAGVAAVAVASLMMGALLGGNLFTLITGEFPGPGPGYNQQVSFKVDTRVLLNTPNPESHVSGPLSLIPPLATIWWRTIGTMWLEPDGTYTILVSKHAGVLTTIGKNWIEDQMGDSPSTTPAQYISLSSSASGPSSAWTQIPTEIVDGNGLARTLGTYASTNDGVWTISKQFTCSSGSYSNVQLAGINYGVSGDNNLLSADTFTPTSLAVGEKITITDTFTITG